MVLRQRVFVLVISLAVVLIVGAMPVIAKEVLRVTSWQFGETGYDVMWNEIETAFEAEFPDIEIERVEAAGANYWTKIFIDIASASPPDIIHVTSTVLAQFIGMQKLEALDNIMDTSDIRENFVPGQLTVGARDGKIYGLVTGGAYITTHL